MPLHVDFKLKSRDIIVDVKKKVNISLKCNTCFNTLFNFRLFYNFSSILKLV